MIKLKIKKSNFTTPIISKNGDYQIIQFRYDGVKFRMSFNLNKLKTGNHVIDNSKFIVQKLNEN